MKSNHSSGKPRILTYGLTEDQNEMVRSALPVKGYELLNTEAPTDLIAISSAALIVSASALDEDDMGMIIDYYTQVGESISETVFWIGLPKPPRHLRTLFKCYDSFSEFTANMKYHFLSAHRKSKKADAFSRQLMYCMMIMKLIRSHPYIRTQEISDKLELSVKTVQRYISALQTAGEWVSYDSSKKGWYLQDGVSPFFDNF